MRPEDAPNVTRLEWMYAEDVPDFVIPEDHRLQVWAWWCPREFQPIARPIASKLELVSMSPPGTIYARLPDRPVFDSPKPPSLEELLNELIISGGGELERIKAEILKHYGGES